MGIFSSGFQRDLGRRLGHFADVLAPRLRLAGPALLVSTTNITSGSPPMSRMPPRLFSSLSRSRVSCSTSFLVRPAVSPDSCSSRLFIRLIELGIVFPLV